MSYLAQDTLEDLQHVARASRANILIVGDMAVSERDEVLRTVRRQRGLDVFHAQRPSELVLPDRGDVILVLDDACELSRFEQNRLLGWMARNQGPIVSFASRSLYGMVGEGRFVERLYYRLNIFCVMLTGGCPEFRVWGIA